MDPAAYDAWYDTPRGRWIGDTEYELACHLLAPVPGETILDVGCGTGWFTRRFAAERIQVTGLDPNAAWLNYARHKSRDLDISWVVGDARYLPFPRGRFDHVVSIASLCFIDDERTAVAEIVRVCRRRFVIGWLNRASLLYHEKAGRGAYTGARWHTAAEVRRLFDGLSVANLKIRSGVFIPSGGFMGPTADCLLPNRLPFGALLVAAGEATQATVAEALEPKIDRHIRERCST